MQTTSTFGTIITLLILHHDNCVIFRMRKRTKSYFYWRTIGWNRFWKSNHLYFHVHACIFFVIQQISRKGQIKPKADWCAIDSPKKRRNEFGFFSMTVRKYLKLEILISSFKCFQTVKQKTIANWFVQFLGESTAHKSAYSFIWPLVIWKYLQILGL